MEFESEVSTGEVLTSAALYEQLKQQNEAQLVSTRQKLTEYESLRQTLQTLPLRARRHVLAPVANGLAFFEAELTQTNNILVLLGEGWFAERTAAQAADVAGRRCEYLRQELQVLQEESKNLEGREALLMEEVPQAAAAAAQLRSGGSVPPPSIAPSCTPSAATLGGPDAPVPLEVLTTTDPVLTTFDEQDELTEDELIQLEKDLHDVIHNDAAVEKAIVDAMIAKKARRVTTELSKRQLQQPQAPTEEDGAEGLTSHGVASATTAAASGGGHRFTSPADIGRHTEALASASLTVSTVPTAVAGVAHSPASSSSQTTEKVPRRLQFSEFVSVHEAGSVMGKTVPMANPTESSRSAPRRVSMAFGDIVEREGLPKAAAGPKHTVPATEGRKRKSQFQRQRDGEL